MHGYSRATNPVTNPNPNPNNNNLTVTLTPILTRGVSIHTASSAYG